MLQNDQKHILGNFLKPTIAKNAIIDQIFLRMANWGGEAGSWGSFLGWIITNYSLTSKYPLLITPLPFDWHLSFFFPRGGFIRQSLVGWPGGFCKWGGVEEGGWFTACTHKLKVPKTDI